MIDNRLTISATVGETYFFRDSLFFKNLREIILTEIIHKKEKKEDRRIRILSAGCSTGEEAYSIAITVKELIPDMSTWNIVIQGIDINPDAIDKARKAAYGRWSFRQVETPIIEKYFKKKGNLFLLHPYIKQMVSFSELNLVSDGFPSLMTNTTALDMVFCRNVLMYFKQETINRIVDKLEQALLPSGYLFVANAELPLVQNQKLRRESKNNTICFRKPPMVAGIVYKPISHKIKNKIASRPEKTKQRQKQKITVRPKSEKEQLNELKEKMEWFYIKSDYQKATEIIQKIYTIDPLNSVATFYEIKILGNSGHLSEAEKLTEQFLKQDKLNVVPYILKALILIEEGKTTEALQYIDKALYLSPDLFIANYLKGNLLIDSADSYKAKKLYKNALDILQKIPDEGIVPYTDGMSAGRLRELINMRLNT